MLDSGNYLSTEPGFLLSRLIKQYQTQDKIVIAYDFDDTVRPYYSAGCIEVQSVLRMSKKVLNPYFIVFTSNNNHDDIKRFLDEENIPYDSINENAPFVDFIKSGDKLFYNVLLDDKSGLGEVVETLKTLNRLVLNKIITKEKNNV